jgi:hypothetical protein
MARPSRTIAAVALVLASAGPVFAEQVSGVLTRTFMIVENTDLIGNVSCTVANGTPCFAFAAPNVELRLNGFSITGAGDAVTGCGGTQVVNEAGITTNGMARVVVRGPGLVQRFRSDGVTVIGSIDARVENVTVSTNCMSGIRVVANSFGTLVQGNTAVRNGSTAATCGGI